MTYKKGHVPWNRGLTKETDERVKKLSESYCLTMKKRYPNWIRGHLGKPHSSDAKKKMSLRRLGKTYEEIYGKNANLMRECRRQNCVLKPFKNGHKPWNKGLTKETDLRIARNAKGMLGNQRSKGCVPWNKGKKMMKDKYPKYWSEDRLQKVIMKPHAKPNEKELLLIRILQNLIPNEYMYVGNGKLIVGGYCPDFMNVNGKKKLIELWGDYWHRNHNTQNRIAHFKKFGFDTLIIWEHELKDFNHLSQKIVAFNENHSVINFLAG